MTDPPRAPQGYSRPQGYAANAARRAAGPDAAARADPPVAIDLVAGPGVRGITITGPNTGGKTAALKTLGLAALMAKAGLFLAVAGPAAPALPWFGGVAADIGDGQSLQQSLSTFSGHVRRIAAIVEGADAATLVLLDEVGSGTDPTEGAALAGALLEHLADRCALLACTTHLAELQELPEADTRFVNAAAEFDAASLRPTYRLLWGAGGQSNALRIAAGLGFEPAVLAAARAELDGLRAAAEEEEKEEEAPGMTESLRAELRAAGGGTGAAEAATAEARAALAAARAELEAERTGAEARRKAAERDARAALEAATAELDAAVEAARDGAVDAAEAERRIAAVLARAGAAAGGGGRRRAPKRAGAGDAGEAAAPRVGQRVHIKKLGGAVGTVLRSAGAGKVVVGRGAMQLTVAVREVEEVVDG